MIYFLWWHKPFDVGCPTIIRGEMLYNTLAVSWMQNHLSPTLENMYTQDRELLETSSLFRGLTKVWDFVFLVFSAKSSMSSSRGCKTPVLRLKNDYALSSSSTVWPYIFSLGSFAKIMAPRFLGLTGSFRASRKDTCDLGTIH